MNKLNSCGIIPLEDVIAIPVKYNPNHRRADMVRQKMEENEQEINAYLQLAHDHQNSRDRETIAIEIGRRRIENEVHLKPLLERLKS